MKNLLSSKTVLAVLSAALVLLAAPAGAQATTLRFDVPFAFTAGGTVLPAGEYHVTLYTDQMRVLISSIAGTGISVVPYIPGGAARPAAQADRGMLRFQRLGDRYFLIGVWRPGYADGHSIAPSPRLLEAAKAKTGREIASYSNLQ